jgi:hypothetical protein
MEIGGANLDEHDDQRISIRQFIPDLVYYSWRFCRHQNREEAIRRLNLGP